MPHSQGRILPWWGKKEAVSPTDASSPDGICLFFRVASVETGFPRRIALFGLKIL